MTSDGIVDAKLHQFFERASSEALELFLKDAGDGTYNLMEIYSDRKGNLTAKSKSKEAVSQRAMLLNESFTLTSVTDGASLSDDAKLPNFFEYLKSEGEDGVRFRDGDFGLEGYITKMKNEAMQAKREDNVEIVHWH